MRSTTPRTATITTITAMTTRSTATSSRATMSTGTARTRVSRRRTGEPRPRRGPQRSGPAAAAAGRHRRGRGDRRGNGRDRPGPFPAQDRRGTGGRLRSRWGAPARQRDGPLPWPARGRGGDRRPGLARLTQGLPALADTEPEMATEPDRLTVTFGFGPGLLERAGTEVPEWLAPLPSFEIDELEPELGEGDLLLQVAADDPLTVSHAVR